MQRNKKPFLSKQERENFLSENWKLKTLCFDYSGQTVKLKNFRDEKLFSVGGYGYDRRGTALGYLIKFYFEKELKSFFSKNKVSDFYGVRCTKQLKNGSYKNMQYFKPGYSLTLDGACGFDCMADVLWALGFKLKFSYDGKNFDIYTLEVR